MVQNYRKKPIEIQAVQFFNTPESLSALQELGLEPEIDTRLKNMPVIKVPTIEGVMTAFEGDFIIKGIRGEFYPCREDIFFDTYEKVVDITDAHNDRELPKNKADLMAVFRKYDFKDDHGHRIDCCLEFLQLVDAYCNDKGE